MEKQIKTFEFDSQEVRALNIEGTPWFVGRDVALVLGYKKPENALATHVDLEDKTTTLIQGDGSNYKSKTILINESGLYSLILKSKLPAAKQFKRWVTSEVLPAIRQTGGYIMGEEQMNEDELVLAAMQVLQRKVEALKLKVQEQAEKIEQDQPKVLFADSVETADTTILVGEMAKILNQNGVDTGQNRFFEWLRDNGYLIKRKGSDYNMPTQKSIDMKLFEIKERTINEPNGSIKIVKTPKVTGKGQIYFINKFLAI